jgi:tRNA modification GTPase
MNTKLGNWLSGDTICAIASPSGTGAIAIVRVSGVDAITKVESVFCPKNKKISLSRAASHTLHYGHICADGQDIDDVLVSVFKKPYSYTGENSIEISCHGSLYIQKKILELLIRSGCRQAEPGEFTMRAFFNGKLDLSQAEAVADIIAANSQASHQLALNQMRGGFSDTIKELRSKLVNFASLIELELDFSEENVEFVSRTELIKTVNALYEEILRLSESFSTGNVIKHGIPVAIIGKPNVGKSTLLNALVDEERAIVSEIPGTTRDTIEDIVVIEGITFRFIDTAGLRKSGDSIEAMGIERTIKKIHQASIILHVFDISELTRDELDAEISEMNEYVIGTEKKIIRVANKTDQLVCIPDGFKGLVELETLFVSAKRKENIRLIIESLLSTVKELRISDRAIVSNYRHVEALNGAASALKSVMDGFEAGIPSDLIATDIRSALHHIGLITGEVANQELLSTIFGRFCIGK